MDFFYGKMTMSVWRQRNTNKLQQKQSIWWYS